jgi:hypothetical protein
MLSIESPSVAAAAAAAAVDVVSKYLSMYSLPMKEKVAYVLPCTFQGTLFGQGDK